jgi:hypothetical protein
MEALLWAASTFSLLALVSSLFSLWKHYSTGSLLEIRSQVRQLDLDVHEAFDVIEKWTRRDRVRRLREGRESAGEPAQPLTLAQRKAELRRRSEGIAA